MAQQHLEPPTDSPAGPMSGDALAGYLRAQATEFLRSLRQHRENGSDAGTTARAKPRTESRAEPRDGSRAGENGSGESVDAARALRRSARRISGTLHTFRPLLDAEWSEGMRPELAWLSGTLAREHAYAARLERLIGALNRLSGAAGFPAQAAQDTGVPAKGSLTVGAAKAGALLDRQLTLARTRAHSAALQALGSSRFHAVADSVAVLASEVPLTPAAATADLRPLAAAASDRLTDAVAALPLVTAGHPYNAEALVHG
ncbi:CHAD domain-containing protein, partial [Streptomyces sp. NPDC057927]